MKLIIGLLVAFLFVFLLRCQIKKYPLVFYGLAVIAVVFYLYGAQLGLPAWLWTSSMFLLQKNIFAFSLFVIVMYVGVLPEHSKCRASLLAIRGELSIIACILSCGHITVFGYTYLFQLGGLTALPSLSYVAATLTALFAVCLMVPLLITSAKLVRKKIPFQIWKRIQWLAYPFFVVVFVHIFMFIGVSAIAGSSASMFNIAAYAIILLIYLVLRMTRRSIDLRAAKE